MISKLLIQQALERLMDATEDERRKFTEGILRGKHHDAFPYELPDG